MSECTGTVRGRKLPPMRAEIARPEAELAAGDEPPKVVALHPAALAEYPAAIDRRAQALAEHRDAGRDGPSWALRDLVESVILHPRAGAGPVEIEVRGHLTALICGPGAETIFPQMRMSGGQW